MTKLPAKRQPSEPPPEELEEIPTWRDLRERTSDLLKDLLQEGKEFEREVEPRLLPALRRLKAQIEKLITKIEARVAERDEQPKP